MKLGTVVLLNSPPKPIDFVPNRFRGKGAGETKIWDPLNISVSDEATFLKFGVHVDSGLFLPADHKLAPQVGVAWGTCPISKFRDPLNMSVSNAATLFKFCARMHHGRLLLADQKLCRNAPGVTEHM